MCKKLLLSAMALTAACGIYAKEVTPQEALQRALATSGKSMAPGAAAMSMRQVILSSDNTPALYLFAGDNDMMVLPADDRAEAVLAYIDNASGEMPPQLSWWLNEYAAQIEYMQSTDNAGNGIYISPRKADSTPKAPIAPLLTTTWNQDSPYNKLCPTSSGQRCMTGCVATAASQVMKYFEYPAKGTGTITYTDNKTTRTLDLSKQDFDWANMLDSYDNGYTTIEANAVAYLMQAVGYASQMSYSPSASGAVSATMVDGVKEYFGYNSAMTLLDRSCFGLADWENIIYEQLKTVGPVYYDGSDNVVGGHAFVCDGYSQDGFFHFNWGWAGAYDGYYKLTALNPEGQGIGGNAGGFNFNQSIVVNFTTPNGATVDIKVSNIRLIGNLVADQADDTEVNLSSDAVSSSRVFIYNDGTAAARFSFGLKAVNVATGETFASYETSSHSLSPGYGMAELTLYIPECTEGTYKVSLIARQGSDGEWLDVTHDISDVNYFNLVISEDGIIDDMWNATAGGVVSVSDLEVLSKVYMNKRVKFSYTVANDTETEIYDGVQPIIFTLSGNTANVKAIGDAMAVDLLPGQSQELTLSPNMYVTTGNSSFNGKAYFGLSSTNTGYILGYVEITVETASSMSASASRFTMVGNRNQADANNLQFNCGLKINRGYWVDPMTVYICSSDGSLLHTLSSEDVYTLSATQSAEAVVSGSFPGAEVGTTYMAVFGYVSGNYIQDLGTINFKVTTGYSGVENVAADSAEVVATEYFTLDGRRVANADAPGIYVVRTTKADGSITTTKVAK